MHLNPYALRVIRERSGLSLSELARLADISQPHLSNLERGRRRASPATVRRLAAALKVPVPALLADPVPDAPAEASGDGEAGPRLGADPRGGWRAPLLVVVDDDDGPPAVGPEERVAGGA